MNIIKEQYNITELKKIELRGLQDLDLSRIKMALNYSTFPETTFDISRKTALEDFSRLLNLVGDFPEELEVIPIDLESKCSHVLFKCQDSKGKDVLVRFTPSLFGNRLGWLHVIDDSSYDMAMVDFRDKVVSCSKVFGVRTEGANYYGKLYEEAYNKKALESVDTLSSDKIITLNVPNKRK